MTISSALPIAGPFPFAGPSVISRREFLARMAVAGAGVGLVGCADSTGLRGLPAPQASGLDHVVILTMENRSYDHLLGWLPGAEGRQAGLSYPDRQGVLQPTRHLTDFQGCGFVDPIHSFDGGRAEYNNGLCDGFLRAGNNDVYSISYYERADLSFLGRAAPEWTVLDHYFTPFLGPTFPNRLVAQAGATDRLSNTATVATLPSIWDRLLGSGLTGRNYGYNGNVSAAAWGTKYASLILPVTSFYSDAAAGTLPNVAFVDPDYTNRYTNSYHPPADIREGEAFMASVYKAVTTSPNWSSTLLIITFDEWGGFYDHVIPPPAPIPVVEFEAGNTDGLRGFRIPTVLVSPFARRRYVSGALYDHASVLKLIEWRWGLEPLTVRDATANNLAEALDFNLGPSDAPVIDVPTGPFVTPCP